MRWRTWPATTCGARPPFYQQLLTFENATTATEHQTLSRTDSYANVCAACFIPAIINVIEGIATTCGVSRRPHRRRHLTPRQNAITMPVVFDKTLWTV